MRLTIKHQPESSLTGSSQTEDKWTGYNGADILNSTEFEVGIEHWYWQDVRMWGCVVSLVLLDHNWMKWDNTIVLSH